MLKPTTTRRDLLQDRPRRISADVLNDPEQPFGAVIDLSICEGRQRPTQESEPHHDRPPLADAEFESQPYVDECLPLDRPQSTKRSRQAMRVATRMSMEHHGWKQTGKRSSLWAFEHRWPHLRDRLEGRNHRLESN